ncbi:hypothetical protein ACP70R_026070 [Stipagrostis hirtigluma subsp. patula]
MVSPPWLLPRSRIAHPPGGLRKLHPLPPAAAAAAAVAAAGICRCRLHRPVSRLVCTQ